MMSKEKILSKDEYTALFRNLILAEYDNLFTNGDLRTDLGLDKQTAVSFAMEYLCAALFVMSDLLSVSGHTEAVQTMLDNDIRSGVFRQIMDKNADEGMEAMYILYSLKRAEQLRTVYQRNDEGMRRLIENSLDTAGQRDSVARMAQSVYLMNLLPGIAALMGDLLRSAESRERENKQVFVICTPDEEQ